MIRLISLSITLALIFSSSLFAASWDIDAAHTNVGFTAKHMLVSTVHGKFTKYNGTISYDEANPSSLAIDATIDVSSINTGVDGRDNHLKSDDFFNAEKYPQITFKSKKTEVVSPGKFKVTGDLTIRDVTKEVTLDVDGFSDFIKDSRGNTKTGASATGTISRKDFNLKWNKLLESGGAVVSDDIKLEIDAELVQKIN